MSVQVLARSNHVALNTMHQQNKTAYRWKDADPICDLLRDAIHHAMKNRHMTMADIAAAAMCGYKTVERLEEGTTRHPMNGTVDRIFKACGFTRAIVKTAFDAKGKEIDSQTMYDVLEKIGTGVLTHAQILKLVGKTIHIKKPATV